MDRSETLALYAQGRDVWNAWAKRMYVKRQKMETENTWFADDGLYLEPKNELTRKWLNEAYADFSSQKQPNTFAEGLNVEGFVFPSDASFNFATFENNAWFTSAKFSRRAWFLGCKFAKAALFEGAEFEHDAMFEGVQYFGNAQFDDALFTELAAFGESVFSNDAMFDGASFEGVARFSKAKYEGNAYYENATFEKDAHFDEATFVKTAGFQKAKFLAEAKFNGATFSASGWSANFTGARFAGECTFDDTYFEGDALFDDLTCDGFVAFNGTFRSSADFTESTFNGMVVFEGMEFCGGSNDLSNVRFTNATFGGQALFYGVRFAAKVRFDLATFSADTHFENARFEYSADFSAIRCERSFSLADAVFFDVPDFVQAHFAEAPRLDNLDVRTRVIGPGDWRTWPHRLVSGLVKRFISSDLSISARWRALKRLAHQGHDHEREQEFFAMEISAARFRNDWPLPLSRPRLSLRDLEKQNTSAPKHKGLKLIPYVVWRSSSWAGFFRFWIGLLYQLFSSFGRSVLRPVLLLLVVTGIFTIYFLSQNPDVSARSAANHSVGDWKIGDVSVGTAIDAWLKDQPCLNDSAKSVSTSQHDKQSIAIAPYGKSTAAGEAFYLALTNSLLVLDGSSDVNSRMYRCLYGSEQLVDRSVPNIPSSVSFASVIQKIISGVAIFLLGLGLRNMLRLR